ncbi:hypothetical protein LCGC14_0671470, partial [marine sediment metagenome]
MADSEWVTITEEDEWETITGPTTIEKVGQFYKEAVAAPVRTIESMAGSIGGLIRMGAEAVERGMKDPAATISAVISKANPDIPGIGIISEHLLRKYGTKRAFPFYERKAKKLADAGKKIQDFWNEQASKGWEAPNPDIVEARWSERPLSKGVSAVYSGLTSIGVVLGTTAATKNPQAGLMILAASETGNMYSRLRDENVRPDVASKLAQMAGAWTFVTEKIGFGKLLAPGKRTILNALKKGGWEGTQEVAEQIGHNLLEYFGYDYKDVKSIPTAVKSAIDHMMDGWLDALVGGIGAGGMVSVVLPSTQVGAMKALDDVWTQVEQQVNIEPQQKERALQHIGDIETEIEEQIIDKFPDIINSQESLERVGNQIAKELGIEGIIWEWNTKSKQQDVEADYGRNLIRFFANSFAFKANTGKMKIKRVGKKRKESFSYIPNKTPGNFNQDYIKRIIVHELGHKVKPSKERIYHQKEFYNWVNVEIKNLFEQVEQKVIPVERPEAIGPITDPPTVEELTKKPIEEIKPQTPDHVTGHQYGLTNEQVDSKLNEADLRYREIQLKEAGPEAIGEKSREKWIGSAYRVKTRFVGKFDPKGTAADIIRYEIEILGNDYGITNEQLKGLEKRPASDLVWAGKTKEDVVRYVQEDIRDEPTKEDYENISDITEDVSGGEIIGEDAEGGYLILKAPSLIIKPKATEAIRTPEEFEEFAFLKENRTDIKAMLERETQPITPPKIKRTQKNLLALGHKIAREAELTNEEYRDFAETITGKRSMKDMSKAERNEFVSALEESYGTPKELTPEDYDIPITVAGRATSMRKIFNEVGKTLETLTPRQKIPAIIKIGFGEDSTWQRAKNFATGIDNTPVYHLARKIDSGMEGIFSEVLDKGTQHGVEIAAGHERQVTEALVSRLQELGVTDNDLAKMGRSVNPRFQTYQMISEGAATETFIETINNQDYKLTWANLIHIYLYSNQEAGMRHIKGGGLVIHGNMTGKISEERINNMRQKVEENPKAKAVADTILEIGEKIWKPSINMVSQRLEGKEIATEPNWFGLRVYMPPKLAGKIRIGKMGQFGVNFIEDKGMFHDRTKSTLPLIVGDVFSEFSSFENATAEYVGLAEATRTSRTLINNPNVATILDQKGYGRVRHHILAIHKQAQSLPVSEGNFSAFFAKRLPALYRAVLHANPGLVASQKTSTSNYGAYVSPKYMKNVVAGLSWKNIQRTLRLSNIAWDRFHMAHSSLALGEMAQSDAVLRMWTGGKSSDINKMGWAIKMADGSALADGMITAWDEYQDARNDTIEGLSAKWWANKDVENMPEMNIEVWEEIQAKEKDATPEERQAAEQWKKLVVRRAEYLWQRTQPSWDKWNRSYLTSQKGLRRVYLLFRSFHEKSLTIFNEAKLDYE